MYDESSHLRTVIFLSLILREKLQLTRHDDIQHKDSWTQKSKRKNVIKFNSIYVDPFSKSLKRIVSTFVAMFIPKLKIG